MSETRPQGSEFLHRAGYALLFFALSLAPTPAPRAAEIGQDGGVTLTVSFEDAGDDCGQLPPPVDDPLAEAHYCAIVEEFSRELFYTTEGNHWIKRVRFLENANTRDVRGHWITKECDDGTPCNERCDVNSDNAGRGCGNDGDCPGGTCVADPCSVSECKACPANSSASYKEWRLTLQEKGYTPSGNPYQISRNETGIYAQLLHHEFGHFFYDLPDEYVNFNDYRGGGTGICNLTFVDNSDLDPPQESDGVICDEQEFPPECSVNISPCVFKGGCIGTDEGAPCDEDDDCSGAGAVCLGMNADRDDKLSGSTKRICAAETALSMPTNDVDDEVCLMRGSDPYRRRWCDHSNHVFVSPAGSSYFINPMVEFDLGNNVGAPGPTFRDHSCWDDVGLRRTDLKNIHIDGVYTDIGVIGLPPATTCEWFVDGIGNGSNPALLVDRSGSMNYLDASNPQVKAIELAMDSAIYFYNRVPDNSHAGIYIFNTGVAPATTSNGLVAYPFAPKLGPLAFLDLPVAEFDTNIGGAIQQATADINGAAGVPKSTRDIVLFSDGKHNDPNPANNPFDAAKTACNLGINVHTIAYGNADSMALRDIALCGKHWAAGTEIANDPGYGEPDPLEMKTAIARMGHSIARETEVLDERASLEPLPVSTIEEKNFVVPDGSNELTFSWLANRTCVHPDPTPGVCLPVLNLLTAVEIESPTGTIQSSGLSPDAENGVYRKIVVPNPEAGTWIARIDKTEPMPPPSVIAGEWDAKVADTRVSWFAHVDHPEIEAEAWTDPRRAPLDMPVTVLARFGWGQAMTRLDVSATVTHAGESWTFPLLDDGLNGDEAAADGLYGGSFNPDGTFANVTSGPYRVKVRMESVDGQSLRIEAGELGDVGEPGPEFYLVPQRGDGIVEAETSFHLSDRYTTDPDGNPDIGSALLSCPDLLLGNTYAGIPIFVDGVPLDADRTTINMGRGVDLSIDSIDCSGCGDISTDPSGTVFFNATVGTNAPTGRRDLWVQTGRDWVRAENACRVCSAPGVEFCNGIDDDCNGLVDEGVTGSTDTDADGVLEACDNCPFVVNLDQGDFDADGEGDRCDTNDGRATIVFTSKVRLEWDPEGDGAMWNVYRGDYNVFEVTGEYTQMPTTNPLADQFCGLPETFLDDPVTPSPGSLAHYLVTSGSGAAETGLGPDGIPPGTERPHHNPCPLGGP